MALDPLTAALEALKEVTAAIRVGIESDARNVATMTPDQQERYWNLYLRRMEVGAALVKPIGDLIIRLAELSNHPPTGS